MQAPGWTDNMQAPGAIRVLVVVHDPSISSGVQRLLEGDGYTVDVAKDASVAMEMAAQDRPRVIVINDEPPQLNAAETCAKLKSVYGDVAVLVMALQTGENPRVGASDGPDMELRKPFRASEFRERVSALSLAQSTKASPPVGRSEAGTASELSQHGQGARVLLVAADEDEATHVSEALQSLSPELKTVTDAQSAVDSVSAQEFDIVIVNDDVAQLEQLDGVRVTGAIYDATSTSRPMPVVLLAEAGNERRFEIARRIAHRVVPKPVRSGELVAACQEALAQLGAELAALTDDAYLDPGTRAQLEDVQRRIEGGYGIQGSWLSWRLVLRAVTGLTDGELNISRPDGQVETQEPDRFAVGMLAKLRHATPSGAWFTMTLTRDAGRPVRVYFDYDSEPAWRHEPRAEVYRSDLERFPRPPEAVPAWLQIKLDAIADLPEPDEELFERLVAAFGRSPDQSRDADPTGRRAWAWHSPDAGMWHLVGYGCSKPTPFYRHGHGYEYTVVWPGGPEGPDEYAWSVLSTVTGFADNFDSIHLGAYSSAHYGLLGIEGAADEYQGFLFVPDPVISEIPCQEEAVQLLRALPATEAELADMAEDPGQGDKAPRTQKVAARLTKADPTLSFPRWLLS